ncbi:hypothetical protein [Dryocola sp. BD626]|uniref:hypothetical protein n=1 Tax=Dryocola sp. BD626 TaxID=3133273 RepID=UPI003F501A5C
MDDMQLDMLECLLAKHIIEIARSDGYVENLLLSRLRSISYDCDDETREAIELVMESFECEPFFPE